MRLILTLLACLGGAASADPRPDLTHPSGKIHIFGSQLYQASGDTVFRRHAREIALLDAGTGALKGILPRPADRSGISA